MKKSRENNAKTSSQGLPNFQAEKRIVCFSIKVQPSLYAILKETSTEKIREILIKSLGEPKKE
jgi:hypothetical protein